MHASGVLRPAVVGCGVTPLKGTRHRAVPVQLTAQGPQGDRRYCLVDPGTGHVLRTVQHPRLLAVQADLIDDRLRVRLPDGRVVDEVPRATSRSVDGEYWGRRTPLTLTDGGHAELLGEWLGRPVRLATARPGDVVYGAPLTLVATASVRELGRRLGADLLAQVARFRATYVVSTDEPWAEEAWVGRTVEIGGFRWRVTEPVPRCAVVDLDPDTGVPTLPVLRALAGGGPPVFGVYAEPAG